MIPVTGYGKLYGIMAIFVLLSAILYFFLHGKKESAALKKLNTSVSA
jgi:hypothetical protein